MHADTEATFVSDYQIIARHLGIDSQLKKEDMLDAVRNGIEALETWVLILDNADDLSLFGVGSESRSNTSTNLLGQVPRALSGTVLWTSRDERIAGTLVGPRRGIGVGPMTSHESNELLGIAGNLAISEDMSGAAALLDELERLPLAISQAGAYMRRTSMPTEEYLALLKKGKKRWQILKEAEPDRHRRPLTPNSILETWAISMERIREENKMAYRMMHVIAYLDHRNLTFKILAKAGEEGFGSECDDEDKYNNGNDDECSDEYGGGYSDGYSDEYSDSSGEEADEEFEVQRAITRLKEFSFLSVSKVGKSRRTYEMHKLVHEATRYQLRTKKAGEFGVGQNVQDDHGMTQGSEYFSGIAVQIMCNLFPSPVVEAWRRCEKYLAHAIAVGEWAEGCGKQVEAAHLLSRVALFLHHRERWRENEPLLKRALRFRRDVLGEKHPDTIELMIPLAYSYRKQGRYDEAEEIVLKNLGIHEEMLGEKHPDTISSMASLGTTYYVQGRYDEAEDIDLKVLKLQQEVLGEKHPDTISSMMGLSNIYYAQDRYDVAEEMSLKVLNLQQEVLGEKNQDTISIIAGLERIYHAQGRYEEAEEIPVKVLNLRQEVLGEWHPDTISSMASLATTYQMQGRCDEATEIFVKVLSLQKKAVRVRRGVLGEDHPDTISNMVELAAAYQILGIHTKARDIHVEVLRLQRELLGENHPETLEAMRDLMESSDACRT